MKTKMQKRRLTWLMTAALVAGCASTPHAGDTLQNAEYVDLEHYMGRWYIISNIPYSAERGRVGAYVEYSLRPDGRIDDSYFSQEKDFDHPLEKKQGIATVINHYSSAAWSVRFGWPFAGQYRILYVDPEYRYSVIGDPSRDYAWILARDMYISDEDYQQLLNVLTDQGFDATRLLKIPPREEYLGIPGYQ